MTHEIRCRVGRAGDLQTAAGVPDEHVAGLEHRENRVEAPGHGGCFVNARAVARYVDGDRFVTERFELGDRPAPAPRAMETAVNQNEAHAPAA